MQRFFGISQDINGNAIPSVAVTVNLAGTATPATLYSDNSYTPLANPFTSNTDGTYQFYAQNGRYDVTLVKTGYTFSSTETSDVELLDVASIISPAQITADQNNYTPTNAINATIWRLTSDAAHTITGIVAGTSGQPLTIVNAGSFGLTLADQSGSSTAANQIITGSGADVTLNAAGVATLIYDGTSSRWRVTGVVAGSVASVFVMSPGSLVGASLTWQAGLTQNFVVAVGAACSDDAVIANRQTISLASSMTKDGGTNWAAGTNQGSLDTGAIGAGWYYVFLILNPTTNAVDVLTSLSATAPTMPAGYTKKRRIGAMKNSGAGNWTAWVQQGDNFFWADPVLDVSAAVPSTLGTTTALSIPTGIGVTALFNLQFGPNNTTQNALYMKQSGATDTAPSLTLAPLGTISAGSTTALGLLKTGGQVAVYSTDGNIEVRGVAASGTYYIATYGWIDRRGKDS